MEILNYIDNREEIKEWIRPYMERHLLIPYIGAGFSKNERTKFKGVVPSGWDLQKKMIGLLQTSAGYLKADAECYFDENLNDFADVFFMEMQGNNTLQNVFQAYMKKNFSKTYDLSDDKKRLLHAGWTSIYTLNYDDVIESNLEGYNVIYPYDTQGNKAKNAELCIYKIHGDVGRYLNTGDLKFIILGKKQYVQTMKDEDNNDMMKTLQNNFYSKSVLFIGCSLTNELDLMYAAEMQLSQKSCIDKDHAIIYVRYVQDDNRELSRKDENQLKMYGITHVINTNEQEIRDFYHDLYDIGRNVGKEDFTDAIGKFSGYQININDKNQKEKDLDFLRGKSLTLSEDKQIIMPSFFISRTKIQNEIIKKIRSSEKDKSIKHVYFLTGQKVSGRTFGLMNIIRELQLKKIFYFPSDTSLSNEALRRIFGYQEAIFLFDENVIERDILMDVLLDNLSILKEQNLFMVVVVNRSDGKFFQYYLEHQGEMDSEVEMVNISNSFQDMEIEVFNDGIRNLSLLDYKSQDTILDYLYQFWNKDLQYKDVFYYTHVPDIHFLKKEDVSEVKAMIVLATEVRVSSKMAVELGIDEALYRLMEKYGQFIQKYYNVRSIENDGTSGFKFVLNSSSWAIRVLSEFADDRNNYDAIVRAYYAIFFYYKRFCRNEKLFHKIVRKYSFLDDIQMLFYNQKYGGSLLLPYQIYEKVHSLIADEFQFLHQSAKCKLQLAKKQSSTQNDKAKYLEDAYRDITRAYNICSDYTYKNVEYTRLHMSLTEALIVSNYIFNEIDSKGEIIDYKIQQERAINAYFRTFCEFGHIENQYDEKESRDIDKFIKYMIRNKQVLGEYDDKLSKFVTEFRNMQNEYK